MGLEIITQPQLFLRPLTALNGVEGYVPPYFATFHTCMTSSPVSSYTFPLTGQLGLHITNSSDSYIVNIDGVVQPPPSYSVDANTRVITFVKPIPPNTEIFITQIGTTVSMVSVASLTADKTYLRNAIAENLVVTSLTALSAEIRIVDITQYELSGYTIRGNTDVIGNFNVSQLISATNLEIVEKTTSKTLSVTNGFITNLSTDKLSADNVFINILSANNTFITKLTALTAEFDVINKNISVNGNINVTGTVVGTVSSLVITANSLSAQEINLINTPANNATGPMISIGQTESSSFSGIRATYDEPTNKLFITSNVDTTSLTSVVIDTQNGNIGVAGAPTSQNVLTVTGNLSTTGNILTLGLSSFGDIVSPNQTINSDSSVLTRTLGDTRYGNIVYAVLEADSATNSTTTYSTIISIPLEANSLYEINSIIQITTSSNGGSKFRLQYSGTEAFVNFVETYYSSAATTTFSKAVANFSETTQTSDSVRGHIYRRSGIIKTSTAVTLSAQMALNSANGNVLGARGSYILARKLV
jgi:hypothetical protein